MEETREHAIVIATPVAMKKLLLVRSIWTLVWAAPAAVFGWVFYVRYWTIRHEFNELGRYWDGTEVHTDSAFVWAIPAVAFSAALCASLFRTWRSMRRA